MQKASGQKVAAAAGPASPVANRLKAIILMCLAVTCFSGLDSSAKYLMSAGKLPATQVIWVRFLGQFLIVLLVLGAVNVPRLLATRRLPYQLLRSALLLASTVLNFLALRELRLDQTTALQFLAPLLVALLAGPLLGEWVGWRRMVAILVGFAGILVVVRPGFAEFSPAMLLALGCVLCYAGFTLVTRYLGSYDAPEVTLFYSLLVGTYMMAPLALVDWVWPEQPWLWLVMIGMGSWAALGHYLFIVAYKLAPAGVVAPFLYVQIVSMTAVGYLVFGDVPDVWTLAGAAIIIASGIYIIYRERKVRGDR
jgi:drug/metabolite transporter (DMT)-like permease